MKHKLFNFIKKAYDFIDIIGQDKVGIYTAQASFFIILSIFPFILLFFNKNITKYFKIFCKTLYYFPKE